MQYSTIFAIAFLPFVLSYGVPFEEQQKEPEILVEQRKGEQYFQQNKGNAVLFPSTGTEELDIKGYGSIIRVVTNTIPTYKTVEKYVTQTVDNVVYQTVPVYKTETVDKYITATTTVVSVSTAISTVPSYITDIVYKTEYNTKYETKTSVVSTTIQNYVTSTIHDTKTVDKYVTETVKVPVTTTVVSTDIVPTTIKEIDYQTKYITETKYVTSEVVSTLVKPTTTSIYVTAEPVYITKTKEIEKYVTVSARCEEQYEQQPAKGGYGK